MDRDPPAAPPGRGSPRNPLRGLRYGTLGLLVLIAAGILYVVAERARTPEGQPLASPETGEGVAQRARTLDITRTRRGLPSLRVTADEAVTYRDGRTVLHDVAVTVYGDSGEKTAISAPIAVSRERSSGGWSFRDGVVLENEDGFRVEVPEINYRESPPELNADGQVLFTTGSLEGKARGLRYLVARRRLEFLSDVQLTTVPQGGGLRTLSAASATLDPKSDVITFKRYVTEGESGERLAGTSLSVFVDSEGEQRRIRSLSSTQGFRAVLAPTEREGRAEPLPGRILTGEDLQLELGEDGTILEAVAVGGVRLSEGDPNTNPRSLSCETLRAGFEAGRMKSLIADGSAHLRIPPERDPLGETATISAESITALFDEVTGEMNGVEATTDVTASHGERTLHSAFLSYDIPLERWTLTGNEGTTARLTTGDAAISAREMEIDRISEILLARGEVKTAYSEPAAPGKGAPGPGAESAGFQGLFGSEEGALHAMSEMLEFHLKERRAHYSGGVRVWRGGGSIEAEVVDYSEKTGVVDARRRVVARIPVTGEEETGTPATVTITSGELRYDRTGMEARFSGGAVANASGMRIKADVLHASGATLGGLSVMKAEGKVSLRQGTVVGDGDRMDADFKTDTFTLYGTGRLATIQDQSTQQLARGAVLTYNRSTGRIQVESESGGRTWITLQPKSERGEQSDPKSPR